MAEEDTGRRAGLMKLMQDWCNGKEQGHRKMGGVTHDRNATGIKDDKPTKLKKRKKVVTMTCCFCLLA